jgi:hypothetical protein
MAEKKTSPTTEKKKTATPKKGTRATAAATPARRAPRRVTKQEAPAAVVESAAAPTPAVRRKPIFQIGTWISILMLVALVELAFYLNTQKGKTGAEDATPTLETAYIFTEADGVVTGIEVKPAEGETVKIARNAENVWAVILPTEAEADQGLAEAAATQLTALPISGQIEDGKSPDIFGLDKPAYVITIEFKDGKKRTLEIGDTTPTNSGYYVRVDKGAMMITDLSGIDALLQLEFSPPYLNTPTPPTETPGADATPTP